MDFNIACALHYASKGEGYLFNKEYYDSEHFKEIQEKLKARENLQDKQQEKNTSYDYGLVTNSIKEIDHELYRSEKWVKSSSKVVFSGLGADEVWAGYSRYKTALLKNG